MSNLKEDDIRRMTFGRFAGGNSVEVNTPDEEIENDETRFIPLKPKTHMVSEGLKGKNGGFPRA